MYEVGVNSAIPYGWGREGVRVCVHVAASNGQELGASGASVHNAYPAALFFLHGIGNNVLLRQAVAVRPCPLPPVLPQLRSLHNTRHKAWPEPLKHALLPMHTNQPPAPDCRLQHIP